MENNERKVFIQQSQFESNRHTDSNILYNIKLSFTRVYECAITVDNGPAEVQYTPTSPQPTI